MPRRASAISAIELLLAEGFLLCRALHLDDAAGAGHDEIGVGLRFEVLGIVEVENGLAAIEAARHGGDMVAQGRAVLEHVARLHPGDAHRAARPRRR